MIQVIAMQDELDDEFVHSGAFGIRGLVLSGGQDVMIAFQMIGLYRALTVSGWDPSPQKLSRGIVART
jgi:hypothetical protein